MCLDVVYRRIDRGWLPNISQCRGMPLNTFFYTLACIPNQEVVPEQSQTAL